MAQQQQMRENTAIQIGNVDENGEEIILEGVCHRRGLFTDVLWIVIIAMASLIAIPIGLLLACCAISCSAWRLYLTRKTIYYRHNGSCYCSTRTFVIPLSYIKEVTAISNDKSVWLLMEREKAYEFIPAGDRPCIWFCFPPENCYLILKHIVNYEEFAQAVKREMAAE